MIKKRKKGSLVGHVADVWHQGTKSFYRARIIKKISAEQAAGFQEKAKKAVRVPWKDPKERRAKIRPILRCPMPGCPIPKKTELSFACWAHWYKLPVERRRDLMNPGSAETFQRRKRQALAWLRKACAPYSR